LTTDLLLVVYGLLLFSEDPLPFDQGLLWVFQPQQAREGPVVDHIALPPDQGDMILLTKDLEKS
jgi:hypothetical protein